MKRERIICPLLVVMVFLIGLGSDSFPPNTHEALRREE